MNLLSRSIISLHVCQRPLAAFQATQQQAWRETLNKISGICARFIEANGCLFLTLEMRIGGNSDV